MSHLTDKSSTLQQAAVLLHQNEMYPAVAHSAYYTCYQLMMHIWLNSMGKKACELELSRRSSHRVLIDEVGKFIKCSNEKNSGYDSRAFKNEIWKLKKLRTSADYYNTPFDEAGSASALRLSSLVAPILKKY
ncbi:MAG: hypothetical protein LBH84_02895 [Prevotellaceae bacterium]|jgi:hypothetical protein|nr:hypothetical protein [Prevotellaceae bacterium]